MLTGKQPPPVRPWQTGDLKPAPLTRRELHDLLARMPVNHVLGLRVARVWKDGLTMEIEVRDELKNALGTLHGGVTATLVDVATGMALVGHYGGQRRMTTVNLNVNYLRPVTDGLVRARARFIKLGRTLAVIGCEVKDTHGHLIATALVTYMMLHGGGNPPSPDAEGAAGQGPKKGGKSLWQQWLGPVPE